MNLEGDLWRIINDQGRRIKFLETCLSHSTATAESLSKELAEANRRAQGDPHCGLARAGVGHPD